MCAKLLSVRCKPTVPPGSPQVVLAGVEVCAIPFLAIRWTPPERGSNLFKQEIHRSASKTKHTCHDHTVGDSMATLALISVSASSELLCLLSNRLPNKAFGISKSICLYIHVRERQQSKRRLKT